MGNGAAEGTGEGEARIQVNALRPFGLSELVNGGGGHIGRVVRG